MKILTIIVLLSDEHTMPTIELVQDIFIYDNVFKVHVPRSIIFELSSKNTHTHRCTHTHTDSDECSIVGFCKNATIITNLKEQA